MNPFIEQLTRLWQELAFNQKVTLVVACLAVGGAMAALLSWSSQPTMSLLYARIDPKDMGDVVDVLEENAVPFRLEQGGTAVFVPKEAIAKMRIQMASRGIPSGGAGVGFEIFDRTNFGISDFIQRTNYMRAIQGELARTITQMQGVRSARVMVVMPENKLLVNNEKARATASVFIDTGNTLFNLDAVNAIRFLVANSVDGLLVDDVAVVDQKGHVLTADMKADPLMGIASGQFKFRQGLETYFVEKIETMLAKVVGANNVVARVAVDLNTESVTKRAQVFDPEGQVVRNQTDTQDTHTTTETKSSVGATGVAANAPQATAAGAPTSTTQDMRKNKTIAYEINQSTTETIKAPGDIKKITAAVFIAQKIGPDGKFVARTTDEISRLKQMVANALGKDVTIDAASITVEEMPFDGFVQAPVVAEVPLTDKVANWVEALSGAVPMALGVLLLLIFLRLVKKAKTQTTAIEFFEDSSELNSQKIKHEKITPDMLNGLIQENARGVSNTLKTWAMNDSK